MRYEPCVALGLTFYAGHATLKNKALTKLQVSHVISISED